MRSLMCSVLEVDVDEEAEAEATPPIMSTPITEAPPTLPPDSASSRWRFFAFKFKQKEKEVQN